ncbi:MAG: DNA-processing protein DprA [Candidatus Acidiferrales bacterium]
MTAGCPGSGDWLLRVPHARCVSVGPFVSPSSKTLSSKTLASAAMKRNEVVCGLADCVIIIEADEAGGTVEAARTARALGKRLYIVDFKDPAPSAAGTAHLISILHAHPLKSLRDVTLLIEETVTSTPGVERNYLSAQPALF